MRAAKAETRAQDLAPVIEEMRALAEGLNARGIPAPRRGRWSAVQVQRVLARGETTAVQ